MAKLPQGYADIIRENQDKTQGFVVALVEPCLAARDKIAREIRRRIQIVTPEQLRDLVRPTSWALAYFLCPGEDLAWFVAWAKQVSAADRSRITFYHDLPDDELARAFAPWAQAGLGPFYEWRVRGWSDVANRFVVDLNTHIIMDAGFDVSTNR